VRPVASVVTRGVAIGLGRYSWISGRPGARGADR
jgi:hypothetical protein